MSIFEGAHTLCVRENNLCKQRNKCKRYLTKRDPEVAAWEAEYYREFGQLCDYFVALPKEPIHVPEVKKAKR